ncbi:glutathione S-transferase family protein [Xylophilus sp.]|uniref:glutathione S-transferase family protein n=1 Tax=Xylophilus sp. TaxID=2653893 RepID=UPI0013BD9FEA|nr:glutathione S-transferase [Xylophilus sp.]KAF1047528.1 MAG: Glutathione S-transferase GST-6.0 [Xylophilus sp.]
MTTCTLYYSPGACSLAPHIVLEEIGAPYTLEKRQAGAQTAEPDFLALNPKGRVPALHGVPGRAGGADGLLTEVPAILAWLAFAHPEAGLLPADAAGRARAFEWTNWLTTALHTKAYGALWRPARFTADAALHPAIVEHGRANVRAGNAAIERILADGRAWAVPGGYGIVDPYLLVFWRWAGRIGEDLSALPAWSAHARRVLARPAVQRALVQEGITAP